MEKASNRKTCRECNAWGRGLVGDAGYCSHCTRVLRLNHNPEECEHCLDGYIDISPLADGGVHKKLLTPGGEDGNYKFPVEGCPTFVQHIGRLTDGSIFDTTRDVVNGKHVGGTDDPFEFQLGREAVIKGWDIGIATMVKGEVSSFIIRADYAYGNKGFPPKVEPGDTLIFEIELCRFDKSLPKFPSQASIDENKKKRAEEERKLLEENPPPTTDEKVAAAQEEKEKGNKLFAEGDYDGARKQYDTAFVHIYIHHDEWDHITSDEDKAKINSIKLPLYLNRSICKLKQGKFKDAEWDCDKAIEIDPLSVKGHYRRGLTFTAKLETELKKEEDKEFWDCEKATDLGKQARMSLERAVELKQQQEEKKMQEGNSDQIPPPAPDRQLTRSLAALARAEARLMKYTRAYEKAQTVLYKDKMMNKLVEINAEQQRLETEISNAQMYDDMPSLGD